MRLTLAEPTYLKESVSIISDLVNEARFKITPDAVELVAMDPANVAMVIFKLFSTAFTDYKVDKPLTIGLNLANLKQLLKRVKGSDIVIIEIEENKLKLQLRGVVLRTFHLPIIDLEESEQKVPSLEFPFSLVLDATLLTEAIEDADTVADSVSFVAEKNKFSVIAEGDLSKVAVEIQEGEGVTIKGNVEGKIKAKYAIDYLKKMVKGDRISHEVLVKFNKDYPLRMDYIEKDKIGLSFILAPRVENE